MRSLYIYMIIIALILLALQFFPVSAFWLYAIFLFCIYSILSQAWNLLAGYTGLISLGQPIFIGLASYIVALSLYSGLSWYTAFVLSIPLTGLIAWLLTYPLFRLRGLYFAIASLVANEVFRLFFNAWRPVQEPGVAIGGGAGYPIKVFIPFQYLYSFTVFFFVLSILLIYHVVNSKKIGLSLTAVRDDEDVAITLSVPVFRLKQYVFVIAAVLTGIAGTLFYLQQGHIEPQSAFGISWTISLLIATIIGGIGTIGGPIIGSAITVCLIFLLGRMLEYSLVVEAVILLIILFTMPHGLFTYVKRVAKPEKKLQKML